MTKPKVNMILAYAKVPISDSGSSNILVIGDNSKKNGLPWHCKEDLERFKSLTYGNTIIVGRKTYMKMPQLENRRIIVLTKQEEIDNDYNSRNNVVFVTSVDEALRNAETHPWGDVFVAGGVEIYKAFADKINGSLYTTEILGGFTRYNEHLQYIDGSVLEQVAAHMKDISYEKYLDVEFHELRNQDEVVAFQTIMSVRQEPAVAQQEQQQTKTTPQKVEPSSFLELATSIGNLVTEKNKAYGSAFDKAGEFLRILYPNGIKPEQYTDMLCTVRIFDKLMRISTNDKGTKEGLEDAYSDITGYGLLGLRRAKEDGNK